MAASSLYVGAAVVPSLRACAGGSNGSAKLERGAMPELVVVIRLRECGPTDEAFEAALADYPLLREFGRAPWEAVNRLVGAHRAVLERRWSP
jgi:hypothetical protein